MSALLVATPDGSIRRPSGEVVFFSSRRFEDSIVRGDCCFVCGASPESQPFANEHVIPRWILREFDLFDREIMLFNNTGLAYRNYTIPCCADCNGKLNKHYEVPVRRLLEGGISAVNRHLAEHGPSLLFAWLALLFVKTHLKDFRLRFSMDARQGDLRRIGDFLPVGELHHAHCLLRTPIVGSRWETAVLGTFFALPADVGAAHELFDYSDLFGPQSILLRYKDVALIAVLNDSCASFVLYQEQWRKLDTPLSPFQLRDVLSVVSYSSVNLVERPVFGTTFDGNRHVIWAKHPPAIALKNPPLVPFGDMRVACFANLLAGAPDRDLFETRLRDERVSFLFGPDGKQIRPGKGVPLAKASR